MGIDLVPFKTCSYDCIYCQLGRTTDRTVERREYVALDEVVQELEYRLAVGPAPDYVTLSGSGEPTLYSHLAPLIGRIRKLTDRPVAVLTNGSLLWDRQVQEPLLEADLVIPSLDAGDEATFQWVNRPHAALSFDRVVGGIEEFCRRFEGAVWLEVLLLDGLNAAGVQLARIVRLADRISPARVQLNTVTRPPSEEYARPLPLDELNQAARLFGSGAEVIADCRIAHRGDYEIARREEILALLRRRPCTLEDVTVGLGVHASEVVKHLDELLREHVLACEKSGTRTFYRLTGQQASE